MEEDNSIDLRVQEGLSRIEQLDRILKAKMEREKQVKRQGCLLRKQIQMQLMEVIKTPYLMHATHSAPSAAIDLTGAVKDYPNGLVRPRQEIALNIGRFLALDSDSIHGPLDHETPSSIQPDEAHKELPKQWCKKNLAAVDKSFRTESSLKYEQTNRENDPETCVNRLNNVVPLADKDQTVGNFPENAESFNAYQPLERSPCSYPGQDNCNYIRRNAELATKASEILPQTASEEARLEELLADDDQCGLSFGFPIIGSEAWSAESTTTGPGVVSAQGTQLDLHSGCQEHCTSAPKSEAKSNHPGETVLYEARQIREDMQRLTEIDKRLEVIQKENHEQMDRVELVLEKMNWLVHASEKENSAMIFCGLQRNSGLSCGNDHSIKSRPQHSGHTGTRQLFERDEIKLTANRSQASVRSTLGRSEPNISVIHHWSGIRRPSTTDCYFGSAHHDSRIICLDTIPQLRARHNGLVTQSLSFL